MDFENYKLFTRIWVKVHNSKGINLDLNYDKFLPLYEAITRHFDPDKGSLMGYMYRAIYSTIARKARTYDAEAPHRLSYKHMCESTSAAESPESEVVTKDYIKYIIKKANLTKEEASMLHALVYKYPDTRVDKVVTALGKSYSGSRGGQLYRSALEKIKKVSAKERM